MVIDKIRYVFFIKINTFKFYFQFFFFLERNILSLKF